MNEFLIPANFNEIPNSDQTHHQSFTILLDKDVSLNQELKQILKQQSPIPIRIDRQIEIFLSLPQDFIDEVVLINNNEAIQDKYDHSVFLILNLVCFVEQQSKSITDMNDVKAIQLQISNTDIYSILINVFNISYITMIQFFQKENQIQIPPLPWIKAQELINKFTLGHIDLNHNDIYKKFYQRLDKKEVFGLFVPIIYRSKNFNSTQNLFMEIHERSQESNKSKLDLGLNLNKEQKEQAKSFTKKFKESLDIVKKKRKLNPEIQITQDIVDDLESGEYEWIQ